MHLKRAMAKANSRRDPGRRSNQEGLSGYASRELTADVPGMLLSASLGMALDRAGTDRTRGVSPVIATHEQMFPPYCLGRIIALGRLKGPYAQVAQPGFSCNRAPKGGVSLIGRRGSFDLVGEFNWPLVPSQGIESDTLTERINSAASSPCAANDPQIRAELLSNQSPLHTSIRLRRQLGTSLLRTRRAVLTSKGTGSAPIAPE